MASWLRATGTWGKADGEVDGQPLLLAGRRMTPSPVGVDRCICLSGAQRSLANHGELEPSLDALGLCREWSDRQGQLGGRGSDSLGGWRIGEFVVAAAQVLQEGGSMQQRPPSGNEVGPPKRPDLDSPAAPGVG